MTTAEAELAGHITDLLIANGRLRRVARRQSRLLDDAAHALQHGRVEVVAEFLDRAASALRDASQ